MAGTTEDRTARRHHGVAWWVTAVLTAAGMLVALWLYSASGLLAPLWAVVALLALWAVLVVVAVRVHRRRGAWSLLVPRRRGGAVVRGDEPRRGRARLDRLSRPRPAARPAGRSRGPPGSGGAGGQRLREQRHQRLELDVDRGRDLLVRAVERPGGEARPCCR